MQTVYENALIRVELEESEIPWLKVFTKESYKEFSETPNEVKVEIFRVLDIIEKEMLDFFRPKKINLASFGNYVPHLHWHIIARFEEDSYFPEPMWGQKQREGSYKLESLESFLENLLSKL
ncbi:MAG TPA: HIT family protein [Campylobacterales bacterium]|nr:HIT family protein [Campylobacterales bacterium]HHS93683.1 HIT family protein [Campylobacterales bacterium]